ncbi:MAG TPA: sulfite exporter TauE/SafE family protein, partial [Gemmatimonadaceae bacterium]|nr:sulfite exporter TauE/SafE family protein [Gemmatimonadaceae bacterium]
MSLLLFTALVAGGSFSAGLLGALTGLGGGIVIVPMLTLLFGVDLRYAIGASLVSVIATSSGAAAAYVKEGYTNVRVGMLLEIATTLGALGGAYLAGRIGTNVIAIIFGVVLLYSAYRSTKPLAEHVSTENADPLAIKLRLNSTYPTPNGLESYAVQAVP